MPKTAQQSHSDLYIRCYCLGVLTHLPSAHAAASDCTTSKKACKNCTCGRADAEAGVKVDLTPDMLDNPQSACGSVSAPLHAAACPL